jgi:hypothetical protein
MNLTPEELTFFRAQRMAAATDAIAFNFALCAQLIAVIPVAQLPGPAFPVPLATMTHNELDSWKDLLVQFYTGKNCFALMAPILGTWKADLLAAPPMPPALTNLQKADRLLLELTTEIPNTLSFIFRCPIGTANRDILLAQYHQAMAQPYPPNNLEVDTVTQFTLFKEKFKTNSRRGCQASLLANINPSLLTAIKANLTRQFPHELDQYAGVSYDTIPEDQFVKFLLLRMSTVEENDKEDIANEFHKIRHNSKSGSGFNFPEYRSYMGDFLLLKEIFGSHLTSWSNKRWAELF